MVSRLGSRVQGQQGLAQTVQGTPWGVYSASAGNSGIHASVLKASKQYTRLDMGAGYVVCEFLVVIQIGCLWQ